MRMKSKRVKKIQVLGIVGSNGSKIEAVYPSRRGTVESNLP